MDKAELAKKLASKSRLNEKEATEFIESFTEVMAEYFKKGEKVVIAEFGSFTIGDNKTVQFNPSAKLKDLVG
ncbi:MAG: HU family DNA-binding protein [Candidatus Berkelbacteria bacterium]|nr:MAG: HU family DNA-binding protein [Candidatus Berkelbacteria bacterium]QQG51852.1 MAG: HU family DNA-binding protein [Candidatus Berkelbacteria bacterium]